MRRCMIDRIRRRRDELYFVWTPNEHYPHGHYKIHRGKLWGRDKLGEWKRTGLKPKRKESCVTTLSTSRSSWRLLASLSLPRSRKPLPRGDCIRTRTTSFAPR